MLTYDKKLDHCSICKHEYTSKSIVTEKGEKIFVCDNCQEATKYNFIWICANCGKVYIRPKTGILRRLKNPEDVKKYGNMMVIQKIEICTECNHDTVFNYNNFRKYRQGMQKQVPLKMPENTITSNWATK